MYGAHANGEDIDPDEAASLEAYLQRGRRRPTIDLDALRIHREIARWRRLAERQARELAALRERTRYSASISLAMMLTGTVPCESRSSWNACRSNALPFFALYCTSSASICVLPTA